MDRPRSQNLTILLTDIKSFTEKTSQKTRSDILSLLSKHKELVLPVLEERGGRLIKTIGDAFLMVFDSPTDAVLAGVGVQESLAEYNKGRALDDRIDVRIAINVGEVSLADDDIFGEPVNITSRIESIAEAGEVYFTEAVYLAMNKREVPSSEVGLLQLKGLAEKVRVYKVKREHPVEDLPPAGAPTSVSAAVPRPAAPRPAAALKGRGIFRRAAGLLIDFAVVGILSGIIAGEKDNRPSVEISGGSSAPSVRIDGKSVQVGNLHIDDKGVRGPGLEISDGGVVVRQSPDNDSDGSDSVEIPAAREIGVKVKSKDKKGSPLFAFVWFFYQTLFLAWWSTTPGGRIMKLKLVFDADSSRIDWKTAAARSLMTFVSTSVACIGWFWALWEKDGRGWHDLVCGTRVEASS